MASCHNSRVSPLPHLWRYTKVTPSQRTRIPARMTACRASEIARQEKGNSSPPPPLSLGVWRLQYLETRMLAVSDDILGDYYAMKNFEWILLAIVLIGLVLAGFAAENPASKKPATPEK